MAKSPQEMEASMIENLRSQTGKSLEQWIGIAKKAKLTQHGEIAPKKAYVSLRRNKQFAIIQPSTATRVDVGINLKGAPTTERLEHSGSFNAMVSHRVRVSASAEVDKELLGWLKQAYEAS